jgi:2,3-bisphosphoglycerate-independent phosphoglycerate mutase
MNLLDDDTLFLFNYRSDRMREIAAVLGLPEKPMEVDVPKNLVSCPHSTLVNFSYVECNSRSQDITTMSRYNADFPFSVAFPPQPMTNVLAEWLAGQGVKQAHIAGPFQMLSSFMTRTVLTAPLLETEKYAHVTFFFNGGVEKKFENEERHMIPSPKVATYDKDPGMSVHAVAEKVAEVLKQGEHEFVMCNFAPPDMVCRLVSCRWFVPRLT